LKNKYIILLMALVLVFTQTGVFAAEEAVNLALYQSAEASSVLDESHPAELANDGINDNETYTWWQSNSTDKSAWWQVDLGLAYKLDKIELAAKIGGDAAERKNFRVLASNTKDFSESVELAAVGDEDYGEVFSADIAKKEKFRFVRIEKTNQAALSIGELRVLANKSGITQGAEAVSIAGQIPATGAEGRYVLPADVIGTPCEKAVQLLSALNIMRGYPDGDFMPGESITRAEFATVIARILGGAVPASNRSFDDVQPSHWAYDAIETAAGLGIVQGVESGIFKPDSTITTPQVIKMLVSALGYGETAESLGGYPSGYQKTAIKLELYEDVTLSGGEAITRGEIAQLVYNALDCDIMRVMGTDEYTTGIAYDGQTVLTEYLHLTKGKGIVTGVSGTNLTDVNRRKDTTYLEIDSVPYYSEIPNLASYLGYDVEFYYDNDETDRPEVVAIIITSRNHTLTLDASELIDIQDFELTYGQEKEEDVRLSEDMDVIYNGVARRVYDYADLLPASGQVTLIDNNGDSSYDVYIVFAIKNYVVSWVNVNKKTVYTKDAAGSLSLDMEEDRISITDKTTGAEVQLDALAEWNILSVMESTNTEGQKCYTVIVSDELIRGQLVEKDENYLTIAGRRVEAAENFDVESIEVGAKGFFYLDAVGKLAAFNGDATPGEQYGFLRATSETNGLDKKLQFRIFTQEGKFETFARSKTFSFNGDTTMTNAEIQAELLTTGFNETEAQPVYYVVNGSGLITEMETTAGTLRLDYDPAAGIGPSPINTGGYYLNAAEVFDALFAYGTETTMIKLPPSGTLSAENEYRLLTSGDLSKTTYYNRLKVYDVTEQNIAKLIVFTSGGDVSAANNYNFFLVDSLVSAINEDGDILYKVSGIYQGKEKSYFIGEDVPVVKSDFKQGTVMSLAFTGEEISDYEIKFFAEGKPEEAPEFSVSPLPSECQDAVSSTGIMGKCFLGYGTVTSNKEGLMTITFAGTTGESGSSHNHLLVRTSSLQRIYRYDSELEQVSVGTVKDILDEQTVGAEDASKVLITADSGNFRELVILD